MCIRDRCIGDSLNSRQKSIIDRCVRKLYIDIARSKEKYIPVMSDFYDIQMCIRDRVLRLLSKDELNLSDIGIGVNGDWETKTALFCVIPDSDKSYNFIDVYKRQATLFLKERSVRTS